MSETLITAQMLAARGNIRISAHGYDELAADDILATDALRGVSAAGAVEDYPAAVRGPTVVVRQRDRNGQFIHVDWGISTTEGGEAVLITAYRPDPSRWDETMRIRRRR